MVDRTRVVYRKAFAGAVGNTLEWYDFAVYGYLAPIIARQFFPTEDAAVGLIATFGVFAAGFLMRPFGSLILGHIADRVGRRFALILSVALMAVPTTLIAVLPTYQAIGVAAPVLLTLLRLLQGLSVGGEYTGSSVYLFEIAPPRHRTFVGSWALVGATFGILLGSGAAALITAVLPAEAVDAWGWRVPFAFGLLVGIFGIVLRRSRQRDEVELTDFDAKHQTTFPVVEAVKHYRPALLRTIACNVLNGVGFYLPFVYISTYLVDYSDLSESVALEINTGVMVLFMLMIPVLAHLADRFGRRPFLLLGSGGIVLLAYPLFTLLHHQSVTMAILGQLGFAAVMSFYFAALNTSMIAQFPRHVRVTAYSICYNIPLALFGGTTPLIATFLINYTHRDLSPSYYIIAAGILAFFVVLTMPRQRDEDID